MDQDPNIERIHFEQIQEFKNLDLYNMLPTGDINDLILLTYDVASKTFTKTVLEAASGGNILVSVDAKLTADVPVNTDKLSVPRGYIFRKDTVLTDVLSLLCNPPVVSTFSATATPGIIMVGAPTPRTLSYDFVQGVDTESIDVSSVAYFKGGTPMAGPTDTTVVQIPGALTYKVAASTLSVALASKYMESLVTVSVAYPHFVGAGATALTDPKVTVIPSDKFIICDFPSISNSTQDFHWFAVHDSDVPLTWVEIDSAGNEDPINRGEISTLFEKQPVGDIFLGNTFMYYKTRVEKILPLKIKINF